MRIFTKGHSVKMFVQDSIEYISNKKAQIALAVMLYFITQAEALESFDLIQNIKFPQFHRFSDYIHLIRPYGWISNFVSIGFGILITNSWMMQSESILIKYAFTGFAIGPLLWGGLYTFNSIFDMEFDRIHPTKMYRPIAAQRISRQTGAIIALTHISLGLILIRLISPIGFILALLMIFFQVLYCFPPFRFKEKKVNLIFSGPINHFFRILIGWTLVQPLIEAPFLFLFGLTCILSVGYLSYKIQDKEIADKFDYDGLESYLSRSKHGVFIFDMLLIILSILFILLAFFTNQIAWQLLLFIPISIGIFLYIAVSSSGLYRIAKPGKFIGKIHNIVIVFLVVEIIIFSLPLFLMF